MHLFGPDIGLLGTHGLVASGIPLAVGAGLSAKARGAPTLGVAFFGDGACNHGAFLESINFATVQKLPVLFVCENNLYATATALTKATANPEIATRAAAFGCPGVAVDGNDVLAVWQAAGEAVRRARRGGGPTLLECKTYRFCGHHEGDPICGVYRTEEELTAWKKRCPIAHFRRLLLEQVPGITAEELDAIDRHMEQEVQEAVRFGESSPWPDPATIHDHLYAEPLNPPVPSVQPNGPPLQQGWLEAVRDGIAEEMRRDGTILYLGEGIAERGGSFAHTKGLWQEFGSLRVIDTPISELAFTGASAGASATGCRAIADVMFVDFLFDAASQIVHQASRLRYLSNGTLSVPLVVRASMGMIKSPALHHSGSYYPCFGHIPGLIVVVPSNPADAKGLIKTALRAGDPVLFLEPKSLFSSKGEVPAGEHLVPFGQASLVRSGKDLTIATCGQLVRVCLDAATQLQNKGISCEVIDLRTIVPLDVETVAASLHKTGRLLVVDEAWSMFGVGAELAAAMMEQAFDDLDAPVAPAHRARALSVQSAAGKRGRGHVREGDRGGRGFSSRGGRRHQDTPRRPVPRLRREPPPRSPCPALLEHQQRLQTLALAEEGVPILMPNMDLTIESAKIIKWKKSVGQSVQAGETVVEVETDKATVEVEAPGNGVLVQILVAEGDTVALGRPVGIIKPA